MGAVEGGEGNGKDYGGLNMKKHEREEVAEEK